jgi:hypothetical protein
LLLFELLIFTNMPIILLVFPSLQYSFYSVFCQIHWRRLFSSNVVRDWTVRTFCIFTLHATTAKWWNKSWKINQKHFDSIIITKTRHCYQYYN